MYVAFFLDCMDPERAKYRCAQAIESKTKVPKQIESSTDQGKKD